MWYFFCKGKVSDSADPNISIFATWSSWFCIFELRAGLHDPLSRTAVPVDKPWACSGVRIACIGRIVDPSPMFAKEIIFWFRIDRIDPHTVTLSASAGGDSSSRAQERGVFEGGA